MIPYLKALDVSFKMSQEPLFSSARDDHATFLVKNALFKEEVVWQPLKELESCSPSILKLRSRALIWGIVCLSTIICCGEIKANVKKCQSYGHFLTLPLISPQPIMVERQTIPHMNALLSSTKILGEQLSSFFGGCHATSSLDSVFFTRKVAWSSLIELHSSSWHILAPTSRAFKWGIICLSSISGSH